MILSCTTGGWAGAATSGATRTYRTSGNWITTWATAQQLVPEVQRSPPKGPSPAPANSPIPPVPVEIGHQTVRMVVHLSTGGTAVRVQLANAQGNAPVLIGETHIARSGPGAITIAGTDHQLTFGGRSIVTIPPGAIVVSDPVDWVVPPAIDLTVSLYLPNRTTGLTTHPLGLRTTYILDGNRVAAPNPRPLSENRSYFWLADVDVLAAPEAVAIAAFGDSITDGFRTTPNRNRAWPSVLYERLQAAGLGARYSVVNLGISGNRVLHDGAGASALARFDRDVLGRPGVRWVVLLEGINDISFPAVPGTPPAERISAEDLIAGFRMLTAQAHMHGIRVMGATILPWEGVWTFSPAAEAIRLKVNQWIRTGHAFDAVVDFDAIIRDPEHPSRLRPQFDSGDHVHPDDAGNRAMAEAIDLTRFEHQGSN